jgi:hypothetical protein
MHAMGTLSAMFLSVALAADGEPLSADELKVAVAALEESRSRLQSFEVQYRRREEIAPGVTNRPVLPAAGESTSEWTWREGQEHYLRISKNSRREWWYDGDKTSIWQFNRDDPPKLVRIWIHHSRPLEQTANYDLGRVTGFNSLYFEGGVLALVEDALRNQTFSGERTQSAWKLALGTHNINHATYEITLFLDPQHDFRLASWQIEHANENAPPQIHRYIVDEFQMVRDEADGSKIWYPLRAHTETALQIVRLEIDSVRINLDLPDSRFRPPEMPFGTEVKEVKIPGQVPKTYLVGGEDAVEQRLAALAAMASKEQDRLDRDGATFDASPRSSSYGLVWIACGALLLVFAGFLYRRRRATPSAG